MSVGAIGERIMRIQNQGFNEKLGLLATGLTDGFERDECLRVSGRQTVEVQKGIRHEDQTPMFGLARKKWVLS